MANDRTLAVRRDNGAALAQPSAIPAEIARIREIRPDIAERALTIIASQVVDDKNPPLQPARAIAAALFEEQTGQICGRDFYADNRMGIVPGYRGVAREAQDRGVNDYLDDYRTPTAQELEDNEIKAGDTFVVCELTIPIKARICRGAGIPYRPTIGYGIVKAHEKKDRSGQPIVLKGGYTWNRKARNRALKDALRHAGFAATAAEILEDAERNGLDVAQTLGVDPEALRRVNVEQAQIAAEQAQRLAERSATDLRHDLNNNPMRRPANFQGFGDEPDSLDAQFAALDDDAPDADDGPADDEEQVARQLNRLTDYAMTHGSGPVSEKLRTYALGCLSTLFGNDEEGKARFLRDAFGLEDPAQMTAGMGSAIVEFVKPTKVDGQWIPTPQSIEFLGLYNRVVMGRVSEETA